MIQENPLPQPDTHHLSVKTLESPSNHGTACPPVAQVGAGEQQATGNKVFDVHWCIQFLEKRGKTLFGEQFSIPSHDHPIVYKLLIYLIGDKKEAAHQGLDLNKGILLTGPVGCGKTSLMTLMRFVPPPERNHIIKSCRDISFEFHQEGYEVIFRYSRMSFVQDHARIYCFDDLGAEQSLKYFGNTCNVMGEILLSRYDLFVSCGMKTHATTNLSASELESYYGIRVRSRLREMFNLIAYEDTTKDKRK